MVEPAKKKKMPNVQFKTAWKFPETGGISRQKAEKTCSLRKFPERVGKEGNFRIRDQKAAGSNPATSTPQDIVNQCSRGFAFPAGFPLSSGLQLSRLQQGGEARISASKNPLP